MKMAISWNEFGELLVQAKRLDSQSSDTLYTVLRDRLLSLARYRVPETAEDVVQETLVIVHRNLAEIETPEGLLAFAHQVLRNKIGNIYQGRSRQRQRTTDLQTAPEPGYEITGDLEATELERILQQSINHLGQRRPHCRAILSCLYHGFDPPEISEQLGISKSKLKVQTFRCRQALKSILSERYGVQF